MMKGYLKVDVLLLDKTNFIVWFFNDKNNITSEKVPKFYVKSNKLDVTIISCNDNWVLIELPTKRVVTVPLEDIEFDECISTS